MTEKEAIKWLKEMQNPMISEAELYCAETCYGLGKMVYPEPEDYVFETAIQALEEIQQYRAIGTIEEFKALKEKNVAKKPHSISIANDIGNSMVECPICHARSDYDIKSIKKGHCWRCGQKLDWSE